jgi:hypothetical protein
MIGLPVLEASRNETIMSNGTGLARDVKRESVVPQHGMGNVDGFESFDFLAAQF